MKKKTYVEYTKEEFEIKLKGICLLLGLNDFDDVTDEIIISGLPILERVYETSYESQYRIRIYSTIDIRTNCTRDVGQDTVKILLLKTFNGEPSYIRLGKHIRIPTLFDNIKKTLESLSLEQLEQSESQFTKDLYRVLR